jgi:hypothetical protein
MKRSLFVLTLTLVAMFFVGCSKLPQTEIDAATTALEQARTAQADLYLENDFLALQDSLNAVVVAIEAKKSKVFGSFSDEKAKLTDISAKAAEIVGNVDKRKEEIKNEIASAQATITRLLEENASLLESAPKGKEGKEALEAIKLDLDGISSSVAEVPSLLNSGDLLGAQTKIKAAMEKATEINTELKTVLEKYLSKK